MIKITLRHYVTMLIGIGLAACSEPEVKEDKVEIRTASPITIAVGDTSPVITVSKTVTEANGRTFTTNPYSSFRLNSGDTAIAGIANLQRIVGKTPGETTVKAKDEKSSMESVSLKVLVVPKI